MKKDIKFTVHPNSPKTILERVYRGMCFSSKDWSTNAFDIALYGIIAGWDYDENNGKDLLKQFKEFNISNTDMLALEEMHQAFIEIENKYYK